MARLYRRRWDIESLFQRLESVLCSEVASLGEPRAALLGFGVAVLAYNVLAVLQAAVRATHDLPTAGMGRSSCYFAAEVKAHTAGRMVAIPVAVWRACEALTAKQVGQLLMRIAARADPVALRKHPRGPKPPKKKDYAPAPVVRRHVSTARVMKEGGVN